MHGRIGGVGLVAALMMVSSAGPSCGGDGSSPGISSANDAGGSGGEGSAGGSTGGSGGNASSGSGGSGGGPGSSSGSGGLNDGGSPKADSGATADSSGDSSRSGGDSAVGACLGASQLAALGKTHLLIGLSTASDPTAAAAPFDLRYEYISGGLSDGNGPCTSCATGCTVAGHTCANSSGQGGCAWWGCYQNDMNPPGEYARTFDSMAAAASPSQIPMFTYYEILQTASNTFTGFQQGRSEVTQAATSTALMARYFADWRFLLQQVGQNVTILQIEPDFWGYAEQAGSDPTALSAAVASANPTDCGSRPNTIAGMGQCMVAMARKYAPHTLVGLSASAWGSNVDVELNTNPSLDVAGEARKVASFLAACGESDADLVIVETSDRDAGFYQSAAGGNKNTWWDATNATLPNFHQDFAWVKALTEALGKPALYWQTPLGNTSLPAMPSASMPNQWQDNRVDYFFGHMGELAAAHAIGAAFGAGSADQTLPETDGGNLIAKTKAYASSGTQALCH
jgi:hypothetical protein